MSKINKLRSFKSIIFASLSLIFILTSSVGASSQTQSFSLTPVTSGSNLADQLVGASSYTYVEPASATQTQVTPENEGHWYGWSFSPYASLPCPQATPLTAHIRALNTLDEEGNPDWSVMALAKNDGSITTPLTPQRPVIEGYSPEELPFAGRWSLGVADIPPATADWAVGIAGPMEAIWDISSMSPTDIIALGVGHDAEDGTTNLQTTVEYVQVMYDTTSCDPVVAPVTTSPSSPKTGDAVSMVAATAAATAAVFLIIKATKNLKAKH